jgi:hypothetical protein
MATTRRRGSKGRPTRSNPTKISVVQGTIIAAAIGTTGTLGAAALGAFSTTGPGQPASQAPTASAISPSPSDTPTPKATGSLVSGDNSAFVTDVTYPDGTKVSEGQKFIKKWEIKNIGSALWVARYLAPIGSSTGFCAYPPRVKIPVTRPGKDVTISVPVTASDSPGICFVTWKMVTATGTLYFPNEIGIWFNVKVVG